MNGDEAFREKCFEEEILRNPEILESIGDRLVLEKNHVTLKAIMHILQLAPATS